jgi:sugar/nucleoside kinase (ribokinase family)
LLSAIQLRPHVSESAEQKFASARIDTDAMAKRAEVIAELESYLKDAGKLDPSLDWRKWRAGLQVLAESLAVAQLNKRPEARMSWAILVKVHGIVPNAVPERLLTGGEEQPVTFPTREQAHAAATRLASVPGADFEVVALGAVREPPAATARWPVR